MKGPLKGVANKNNHLCCVTPALAGNGDAHLKNFSVVYRHAEDVVELAPAYDVVSTQVYLPKDSLALTLDGSKAFPGRARLIEFVRQMTGKTERAAGRVLEQVRSGAEAAMLQAAEYGKRQKGGKAFVQRFSSVVRAGLARLDN